MAIANITGNILTDSGVATSSLLPLSGGTLTGALSGTSASFSVNQNSTITNSFINTNTANNSSRTILNVTAGNATLQIQAIHSDNIYITPSTVTDTYLGYNNILRLLANGNAIFLNSNVGIGTSSPSSPLDVVANNSTAINLRLRGRASDSIGQMEFWNNAQSTRYAYIAADSTSVGLASTQAIPLILATNTTERMRITSGGVINTTSRLNVNGAGDNSLFSFINNGTTYTLGFSPNASASTSNSLTITTTTTTWIYNGTGTATWTLPTPSGTNQMFWIRNAGTGTLTLNAFSGTSIVNTANSLVSSITIAVGATALIQQDGNIRSYQLQ